jgi:hypothetical protein
VILCKICGGYLAKINGRTLKEALAFTKASFHHRKKLSNTQWVDVCPSCDAYALGIETVHPWPFQAADGVMRVANDYDQSHMAVESETLELCGFKFSEAAIRSTNALLSVDAESVQALEAQGAALSMNSDPEDFLRFSRGVCEWGRGKRVWANLNIYNESENLSYLLKSWLIHARSSSDDEEVIAMGVDIKGLGVSFASKHLRMLSPERYAVLDDVLRQGLGVALNPRGYRLFMSAIRALGNKLEPGLRVANLEGAIFLLVRQDVRAKTDA